VSWSFSINGLQYLYLLPFTLYSEKKNVSSKRARQRWCDQDHANVAVESSTSSDRQKTRPDVRRNSVDMSVLRIHAADDRQQNSDADSMLHLSSAACQSSAYDRCSPRFIEIIALMNAHTLRCNFSGDRTLLWNYSKMLHRACALLKDIH